MKEALVFIKDVLEQYLRTRYHSKEDVVILNHLVEPDGTIPLENQNKVVLTMINLENESAQQFRRDRKVANEDENKVKPPSRFTIDLLITAHFEKYEETLHHLNSTIGFFHLNETFDKASHPGIDSDIDKLALSIENLGYVDTHNLWSSMGAKYQPSIIYKLRYIIIDPKESSGSGNVITAVSGSLGRNP